MIFLKTDTPNSVAVSTYKMAQQWHAMKSQAPEKLTAPMRVTLLQHLLLQVRERTEKMMETPSSRSTAISLGWLSEDEKELMGLRWDQETRRHVPDETVKPIAVCEAMEILTELITMIKEPLVVARYHATRPLSEQYQSPTLTMLLEIGLRTGPAHSTWTRFQQLAQSAMWVAAGGIPEAGEDPEEPSGPEAGCLDQVLGLRLGNRSNFCCCAKLVASGGVAWGATPAF